MPTYRIKHSISSFTYACNPVQHHLQVQKKFLWLFPYWKTLGVYDYNKRHEAIKRMEDLKRK